MMKHRTIKPTLALWGLFLLLGLLAFAPQAHAQRNEEVLWIQVLDADGKPVPDLQLNIYATDSCNTDPGYFAEVKTDDRGNAMDTVAAFRCNMPASYEISYYDDCNREYRSRRVTIGKERMPIVIEWCSNATPKCDAKFEWVERNAAISFVNQSTANTPNGRYESYWTFGDNNFSYDQSPNHNYREAGRYEVCLFITTPNGCTDTTCQWVNFANPDTNKRECKADFDFTVRGNEAAFTSTSKAGNPNAEITRYRWVLGNQVIGGDPRLAYTFRGPGTYNVCLTIVTNDGCENRICKEVIVQDSVNNGCKASFESMQSNIGTSFTSTSEPSNSVMSFFWDFGDNSTSQEASPTHMYRQSGTYEVCLTITSMDSCTSTTCKDVVYTIRDTSELTTLCFNVALSDLSPADTFMVVLYQENTNPNINALYNIVDTLYGAGLGPDSGMVCFPNLPRGKYIAWAALTPSSRDFRTHVPTYYTRSLTWRTATAINTNNTGPFAQFQIVLISRREAWGPARARGNARRGPGKNSEEVGDPMANVLIIAMVEGTEEVATYAYTDSQGNFTLDELPYGTYVITAERVNRYDASQIVVLSAETPEVNDVEITLHENPVPNSRNNNGFEVSEMTLYPNPTAGQLQLRADWLNDAPVSLQVIGMDGRVIKSYTAPASTTIDVSELPAGLYLLRATQGNRTASRSFLRN